MKEKFRLIMIQSALEFKKLRESELEEEYSRSANEIASIEVWEEVLTKFPDLAFWVAHNKKIPIEILYKLALDQDVKVREMVARKRKVDKKLLDILKNDKSESVRYVLLCNTKLSIESKNEVNTSDSEWLTNELNKINTVTNMRS